VTIGTGYLVTYGIAVDSTGKVDIAGQAYVNSTLPAGANSYNATPPSSGWAGFLVQISADGSATPYATYIYGNSNCYSTGVAVDSSGNAYISGYGYGAGFRQPPGPIRLQPPTPTTRDSLPSSILQPPVVLLLWSIPRFWDLRRERPICMASHWMARIMPTYPATHLLDFL
jgi:hypothetical protein